MGAMEFRAMIIISFLPILYLIAECKIGQYESIYNNREISPSSSSVPMLNKDQIAEQILEFDRGNRRSGRTLIDIAPQWVPWCVLSDAVTCKKVVLMHNIKSICKYKDILHAEAMSTKRSYISLDMRIDEINKELVKVNRAKYFCGIQGTLRN
jgi:hypothetical protein